MLFDVRTLIGLVTGVRKCPEGRSGGDSDTRQVDLNQIRGSSKCPEKS